MKCLYKSLYLFVNGEAPTRYLQIPWVLAITIAQIFYILDPKVEKKYIIVPEKHRVVRVDDVEDEDTISVMRYLSL
jgi:hypothetical protein